MMRDEATTTAPPHGDAPRVAPIASRDEALVERLRAHDERAFVELVERHTPAMLRLARVFVSSDALAEEVVQETWTAVLVGLADFECRASLKTWMFRILVNRAKTRGVREARSVPFSALGSEDDDAESTLAGRFAPSGSWREPPRRWEEETPEGLVANAETAVLLKDAIAELPPQQRAVLTLRDIEGEEAADVCAMLAISDANQRVLLHRARTHVRAALEQKLASDL